MKFIVLHNCEIEFHNYIEEPVLRLLYKKPWPVGGVLLQDLLYLLQDFTWFSFWSNGCSVLSKQLLQWSRWWCGSYVLLNRLTASFPLGNLPWPYISITLLGTRSITQTLTFQLFSIRSKIVQTSSAGHHPLLWLATFSMWDFLFYRYILFKFSILCWPNSVLHSTSSHIRNVQRSNPWQYLPLPPDTPIYYD